MQACKEALCDSYFSDALHHVQSRGHVNLHMQLLHCNCLLTRLDVAGACTEGYAGKRVDLGQPLAALVLA